jgi:4-amino-4-deoxy-L-arabinose transferase-like glycosyltransferase
VTRASKTVLLLALAAFALRLAALALQGPAAMDWDAANYARIAQNIHDGVGNVTLRGVPNVLHAPLYPMLMAALLFFMRSPEAAGIAISLVSGTLLVVLVYRLTAAIADDRAALVAGGLAALYPFLIDASIVPLSEALFLALAFAGLDALVRVLKRPSLRRLALAGLCFGGAYLTREQGLAYVVIGAVAVIVAARRARTSPRIIATRLAALLVPFFLCAAPYVAFLAHATGHVGFEAKSVSNYGIAIRMSRGLDYVAAADAIGPNLEDVGVEVGPSYPFSGARVPSPSLRDRSRLALQAAPRHAVDLVRVLGAKRNGSPLFLLFALVGLVAQLRARTRGYDLILVACLLAEFAALLTIFHFWDRYADPFAALLLPWTACGIVVAARYARRRLGSVPHARLAAGGCTIAVVLGAAWFTLTVVELRRNAVDPVLFRDAGAWVSEHSPRNPVVMAVDPLTAYYSGGTWRALPFADGPTALRYIGSRAPDFVVISTLFADRPYLDSWVADGIPDAAAHRVFEEHRGNARLITYRWTRG